MARQLATKRGQMPTDDHWHGLMVAAQAGNGGAYRRLLTEIDPWLRRFYSRRLPHAFIDDAVQETLIAIHTKRHTYTPDRPFRPWLAAIARYKWIDRLRSMSREAADELPEDLATGDHGSEVMSNIVLEELLGQLKPAQSTVIRLVKIMGCSIEEAAEATGQSLSLVKVNIHRGLAKLQAAMTNEALLAA